MSTAYEAVPESRIVRLVGAVDDDLANQVTARLLLLAGSEPAADILLRIESPGGSVAAGMAVYDTMQYIGCDVATCAVGLTAGMGQFLLTGGALGKRFAERDARIVMVGAVHSAVRGGDGGADAREVADAMVAHTRRKIAEIAALHMGRDPEFVEAAWKARPQREFRPEEARVYGLIDHILGPPHPGNGAHRG